MDISNRQNDENSLPEIWNVIQGFFSRKKSNIIYLFDFCCLESQGFITTYWVAFYFMKIGFEKEILLLSIISPVSIFISSLTYVPFLASFTNKVPILTSLSTIISFLVFGSILFVKEEKSSFIYYLLIMMINKITISFPYSRTVTSDLICRVEG